MFREARLKADLTQDRAIELISVGKRNFCRYEKGERVPPPDVTLGMTRAYKRPELAFRYCKEYCPIGQALRLSITKKEMPTCYLRFQKEFEEVKAVTHRLIIILGDGLVDENEKVEFWSIMKEVIEMKREAENLLLAASEVIDIEGLIREVEKEKSLGGNREQVRVIGN